jgi:hypothetical protein
VPAAFAASFRFVHLNGLHLLHRKWGRVYYKHFASVVTRDRRAVVGDRWLAVWETVETVLTPARPGNTHMNVGVNEMASRMGPRDRWLAIVFQRAHSVVHRHESEGK